MTRRGPSRSTLTLVLTLSVGAVALGVAVVFWALMNITNESVTDLYSAPTVSAVTPDTVAPSATPTPAAAAPESYPRDPSEGDRIGSLTIPALKQTLPIIEGTRDEDLKRGVGHFVQSVLPGKDDNSVLSGHRDTVFAKLGQLKIGDEFVVETAEGTHTYGITAIRIVDKEDRTVIVPTDHAVLTVSTCYPFDYVGSAPDRYVLSADLLDPPAESTTTP